MPVTHNQSARSFFFRFFFLPDRGRAKGRFKVGPFDAAGCDHGATKLYGARADPPRNTTLLRRDYYYRLPISRLIRSNAL